MRRVYRVRYPLEQSILYHNINIILKEEHNMGTKKRCVRLTYDPINEWNWFIHNSTKTTDRGKLFNLQMCLYLRNILKNDPEISASFEIKFFQTGSLHFIFFF